MTIPPIDPGVLAQVVAHARRRAQYSALQSHTPYTTLHVVVCLADALEAAEADARALALAACTFATAQQVADAGPAMRRWAPAEPPQPRSAAEILEEHKEASDG